MSSNTPPSCILEESLALLDPGTNLETTATRRERSSSPISASVSGIHEVARRGAPPPSRWSVSSLKRLFDIGCVLGSLPITLPVMLLTGLAVRLTSRGPVLFRQARTGRNGQAFTIYKFRTMPVHRAAVGRPVITTTVNQRFTVVGPFLRRWKLDELPQILNVLRGDMSLVGPRPKVPSHQKSLLTYRPGITGRATVVFAREEVALASIPLAQLATYYHDVILPLKQALDDDYMSRATFTSDLKLLVSSVLRRWDYLQISDLGPALPNNGNARSTSMRPDAAHMDRLILPSQKAMSQWAD